MQPMLSLVERRVGRSIRVGVVAELMGCAEAYSEARTPGAMAHWREAMSESCLT